MFFSLSIIGWRFHSGVVGFAEIPCCFAVTKIMCVFVYFQGRELGHSSFGIGLSDETARYLFP